MSEMDNQSVQIGQFRKRQIIGTAMIEVRARAEEMISPHRSANLAPVIPVADWLGLFHYCVAFANCNEHSGRRLRRTQL